MMPIESRSEEELQSSMDRSSGALFNSVTCSLLDSHPSVCSSLISLNTRFYPHSWLALDSVHAHKIGLYSHREKAKSS